MVKQLRNNKFLRYAVFAAAALFFVFITILVTRKKPLAEKEDSLPAVIIQKPVNGTLVEAVTISGYVEADAMIPVVPFVSGTIIEYPARAGDFVEKDTLLAKIDGAPFKQQMLQAQAAYFAAQSTFDRIEKLYKSGELNNYNRASRSRIEKKYKEYKETEKESEEIARKAAEEEEAVFALASDGPKCIIKNFPENKPIDTDDDKK